MARKTKSIDESRTGESLERGIVSRLKEAIDRIGGAAEVSRRSGVPMSTLSNYLTGTEARFTRMAALAAACNVSLDWIATGKQASTEPEIPFLSPANLYQKAHFWGLFVLLRSCQEYNEQMKLHPTLADVFEWIGPAYEKVKSLPDNRIDFKPPAENPA